MKKWQEIFTEADRELARKAGFLDVKQEFGKRPALIIIDVNRAFVGSQPKKTIESIQEYRLSCGEAGWEAIENIKKLISYCRVKSIPIVYTTNDPIMAEFTGLADKKSCTGEKWAQESQEIAEEIKPLPTDPVIRKVKASGFFGTPLATLLNIMKIDCLLVTGTSTSGCVRATVVDAFSYRYRCFVIEECVFDRFELSHLVSLWDMNAKYADVISMNEALNYLNGF